MSTLLAFGLFWVIYSAVQNGDKKEEHNDKDDFQLASEMERMDY